MNLCSNWQSSGNLPAESCANYRGYNAGPSLGGGGGTMVLCHGPRAPIRGKGAMRSTQLPRNAQNAPVYRQLVYTNTDNDLVNRFIRLKKYYDNKFIKHNQINIYKINVSISIRGLHQKKLVLSYSGS